MKIKHPKFKYVFLAEDITVFTILFFMSLTIVVPEFWSFSKGKYYFYFNYIIFYVSLTAIYIFSFRLNNLYKRKVVITRYRHFILLVKALIGATIFIIIVMVFINLDYFMLYGKPLITHLFLLNIITFTLIRAVSSRHVYAFMSKGEITKTRVLILGSDEAAIYALKELQSDPFADFIIVGFLDEYKETGEKILDNFYNLGKLSDLDKITKDYNVDEIFITIDNAPYERLINITEKCLRTGKSVKIFSNLLNVIAEKVDVEKYSNIPAISLSQIPLNAPVWDDKRILDIILSSIALVILSPVFLVVSIGIKLSSKGPVIFKQERIGKDGRPFCFYKFRSMHMGCDTSKHKAYVQNFINNKDQCEKEEVNIFKIMNDPNVFKFGKFIRKTSIDEMPQLFNVIKGDMSLVGPRPCLPYEWNCYEDWHKKRLKVLPGCTGVWQALGRSVVSFEEMVILDLYYISNMSLWLDLKIFLQTIPVIFFAKGGY